MEWIGNRPSFEYEVTTKLYRKVGVAASNSGESEDVHGNVWIEVGNTVKESIKPYVRAKLTVAEADELITALMYARKMATGEAYEIP